MQLVVFMKISQLGMPLFRHNCFQLSPVKIITTAGGAALQIMKILQKK